MGFGPQNQPLVNLHNVSCQRLTRTSFQTDAVFNSKVNYISLWVCRRRVYVRERTMHTRKLQ